VIGGFYIGKRCCILHALGNNKENLVEFNLADFRNSPNRQNKFYAKFSSYTVSNEIFNFSLRLMKIQHNYSCSNALLVSFWVIPKYSKVGFRHA